jgi:hypothetical protein
MKYLPKQPKPVLDRENRSGAEKVMKWRQALKIVARAREVARRLAQDGVALPVARRNASLALVARLA